MTVKINNSDESQTGGSIKYTGLTTLKPLIVNPTKEQMEKMGMKSEKEPEYIKVEEKDGKKSYKTRLTFFLTKKIGEGEGAHNLIVSHSVFLEPKPNYNKKGDKVEVIDKFGKSSYISVDDYKSKNIPYDWLDKASIKVAYVGQAQLINFMRAIAGSSKEDETVIEDFCAGGSVKSLFDPSGKGLSELKKDIFAISKTDNVVKLLLGVRVTDDGKIYQEVFNGVIGRPFFKTQMFHKELKRTAEYSNDWLSKRDFGPIDLDRETANEEDYRLRVYDESSNESSSSSSGSSSDEGFETDDALAGDNDFINETVGSESKGSEDDPFSEDGFAF